jgi:hypothetical protein
VSTADAVAREAAWLNTTSGDSLPFLPATAGGPWQVIDAYTQGAQTATQKHAIYVLHPRVEQVRVANQRVRSRYLMRLELHWPVVATLPGASSISAQEQQLLDSAVEQLRARITGPLGDKSHGGRFLAAGEVKGQPGIVVEWEPALVTIKASKEIRAAVFYPVDDFEINA